MNVGSDFFAETIKPSSVIARYIPQRLFTYISLARCQNSDSSLIPYFQFFGPTDNQP